MCNSHETTEQLTLKELLVVTAIVVVAALIGYSVGIGIAIAINASSYDTIEQQSSSYEIEVGIPVFECLPCEQEHTL